jgi:UDP-glucose/iron transport system permease protein
MNVADISPWALAAGYGLLLFPLGIILWKHLPILGQATVSVVRMTIQLLFVGLYLQVVFKLDNPWLNVAWVAVMIVVADISIIHGCRLRLRRFMLPLLAALVVGTAIPLLCFLGLILRRENLMEAQYVIPLAGMILGNCLRADIIGVRTFYDSIRKSEKAYLNTLAQGARLHEAIGPYFTEALQLGLMPTIASIATIGLVALPGMMTGVILGGADPMVAIKYQIAIMIAIFCGTSITVFLAIWLTSKSSFTAYGVLDRSVFKPEKPAKA